MLFRDRADYQKGVYRITQAIAKYRDQPSGSRGLLITQFQELAVSSYQLAKLINEAFGFVSKKRDTPLMIFDAIKSVEYNLHKQDNFKCEAEALEALSQICYGRLKEMGAVK
jgi:hypothetical protein